MYNRKNEAREERKRQKLDSGPVAERFPQVSSIVIAMKYLKEGATSLLRTLTFNPASHAFFRLSCLGEDCADGELDLTRVLGSMIRNRKTSAKGSLKCSGSNPDAVHADISYEISIKYFKKSS